jgi:hypothetical protein
VDVGGGTVRVFGRPEELAESLEASGYDIPANEIEAGTPSSHDQFDVLTREVSPDGN